MRWRNYQGFDLVSKGLHVGFDLRVFRVFVIDIRQCVDVVDARDDLDVLFFKNGVAGEGLNVLPASHSLGGLSFQSAKDIDAVLADAIVRLAGMGKFSGNPVAFASDDLKLIVCHPRVVSFFGCVVVAVATEFDSDFGIE